MKCRAKRLMNNPVAEYNAAGRPVTRGVCPECGTALYRMGETPAHADIPKPTADQRPAPAKKSQAATAPANLTLETVSAPGEIPNRASVTRPRSSPSACSGNGSPSAGRTTRSSTPGEGWMRWRRQTVNSK